MRFVMSRRAFSDFIAALEFDRPILGAAAEGNPKRSLLLDLGFGGWQVIRRIRAVTVTISMLGRRFGCGRTLECAKIRDPPDCFDARRGRRHFFPGALPVRFDCVAAFAISALLR
jgi:hypothetical protein